MFPVMAAVQTSLGQTVRAATHRALEARERLLADYPQWEDWRRQVRASKTATVDRWQEYLALFIEEVEAWGGEVHFAEDAAEAKDFILRVARRHQVTRVVQSKSMTAHEISLEPFLSRHGIQLTETDLGEFIIQLAGHPPAHLTAPALHLDRHRISRILSDSFRFEAPADPTDLTRLASKRLAPRYIEAEMGITGVNFAAAQDGTLVYLENEGNLRQTASLPLVHLAIMGWEKLVPGLSYLEPFLRLLPASATGQRLTSLVHFQNGLKAGPQGSQAFYLVVLDNGRSRLAAHPELREALYCLRCGACLNICPVFQVGGAHLYGRVYPGAIGALLAPFLPPCGDISDLCTQCGSCGEICPAAIELPKRIRLLRQNAPAFGQARALAGAARWVLGQPRLYRTLESPVRFLGRGGLREQAQELLGGELPDQSFFKKHQRTWKKDISRDLEPQIQPVTTESTPAPEIFPQETQLEGNISPELKLDPAGRLAEVGTDLINLEGAEALARYLNKTAQGEVWLEDHPWLLPVAQELTTLGAQAHLARDIWAPEADTAVTLGLGVIPELGSVLVDGGQSLADWLPLRARRHVVVVPPGQTSLDIREGLKLVKKHQGSLMTWLTGPTRTADIEKILVLGAQGPAEMTVVLYQPQSTGK
jgi:L-lactate dehydrogenase complex protein LldF